MNILQERQLNSQGGHLNQACQFSQTESNSKIQISKMLKNLKQMNRIMKAGAAEGSLRHFCKGQGLQIQGVETLGLDLSYEMFNSFKTMGELLRTMDYGMLLRINKRRIKKEFLVCKFNTFY